MSDNNYQFHREALFERAVAKSQQQLASQSSFIHVAKHYLTQPYSLALFSSLLTVLVLSLIKPPFVQKQKDSSVHDASLNWNKMFFWAAREVSVMSSPALAGIYVGIFSDEQNLLCLTRLKQIADELLSTADQVAQKAVSESMLSAPMQARSLYGKSTPYYIHFKTELDSIADWSVEIMKHESNQIQQRYKNIEESCKYMFLCFIKELYKHQVHTVLKFESPSFSTFLHTFYCNLARDPSIQELKYFSLYGQAKDIVIMNVIRQTLAILHELYIHTPLSLELSKSNHLASASFSQAPQTQQAPQVQQAPQALSLNRFTHHSHDHSYSSTPPYSFEQSNPHHSEHSHNSGRTQPTLSSAISHVKPDKWSPSKTKFVSSPPRSHSGQVKTSQSFSKLLHSPKQTKSKQNGQAQTLSNALAGVTLKPVLPPGITLSSFPAYSSASFQPKSEASALKTSAVPPVSSISSVSSVSSVSPSSSAGVPTHLWTGSNSPSLHSSRNQYKQSLMDGLNIQSKTPSVVTATTTNGTVTTATDTNITNITNATKAKQPKPSGWNRVSKKEAPVSNSSSQSSQLQSGVIANTQQTLNQLTQSLNQTNNRQDLPHSLSASSVSSASSASSVSSSSTTASLASSSSSSSLTTTPSPTSSFSQRVPSNAVITVNMNDPLPPDLQKAIQNIPNDNGTTHVPVPSTPLTSSSNSSSSSFRTPSTVKVLQNLSASWKAVHNNKPGTTQ